MSTSHSVSELIQQLKNGNPNAAQQIWDRYVKSLVRIANSRLRTSRVRLGDEEDAVVTAFAQFLERVDMGGFSKLDDRSDLWRILVLLTERRAFDMIRKERTLKNGGHSLVGESHLGQIDEPGPPQGLDRIAGSEPSPQFAATMLEEFEYRIGSLEKEELKQIAILKMKGFSNREISGQVGLSLRSIERKLGIIRETWQHSGT